MRTQPGDRNERQPSLCDDARKKGAKIRLTRNVQAYTRSGIVHLPAGSVGTITSAGEVATFAEVGGHEMELFREEFDLA